MAIKLQVTLRERGSHFQGQVLGQLSGAASIQLYMSCGDSASEGKNKRKCLKKKKKEMSCEFNTVWGRGWGVLHPLSSQA